MCAENLEEAIAFVNATGSNSSAIISTVTVIWTSGRWSRDKVRERRICRRLLGRSCSLVFTAAVCQGLKDFASVDTGPSEVQSVAIVEPDDHRRAQTAPGYRTVKGQHTVWRRIFQHLSLNVPVVGLDDVKDRVFLLVPFIVLPQGGAPMGDKTAFLQLECVFVRSDGAVVLKGRRFYLDRDGFAAVMRKGEMIPHIDIQLLIRFFHGSPGPVVSLGEQNAGVGITVFLFTRVTDVGTGRSSLFHKRSLDGSFPYQPAVVENRAGFAGVIFMAGDAQRVVP